MEFKERRENDSPQSVLIFQEMVGNDEGRLGACREQSVQELLLRVPVSDTGELKPFEALLHVKIAKGVPIETDFVSLRKASSP